MNDNDVDDLARVLAERLTLPGTLTRTVAAAVLASGVVVSARDVKALTDQPDEDLRMDAYYYGFAPTGVTAIDRILSAIAHAGKAYHHTESWHDDWAGRGEFLPHGGDNAVDAIQNAANAAAERVQALLREPATDAAVKGTSKLDTNSDAAPTGDDPWKVDPRAGFWEMLGPETGYDLRHRNTGVEHVTGEDCPCQPERLDHLTDEAESGHRSATDASEPGDPYPSDPQPVTGPQEDA